MQVTTLQTEENSQTKTFNTMRVRLTDLILVGQKIHGKFNDTICAMEPERPTSSSGL